LSDVLRVCAGILALILIFLSYLADPHTQSGLLSYLEKSYFIFGMGFGGLLLIIGLYTKIAAPLMLVAVWAGFAAQLLGSGWLIPVSFSMVLIGVTLKGPGQYTFEALFKRRSSRNN
jgi:hypothetical protein